MLKSAFLEILLYTTKNFLALFFPTMVCTRTGKSTNTDNVLSIFDTNNNTMRKTKKRTFLTKQTSNPKPSFDIFIETTADIEAGPSGTTTSSPVAKKARVLTESTHVHLNALPIANNIIVLKDVKKVSISSEEKAMNGAPEGDLYDVVLMEDSALQTFESTEAAAEQLSKQLTAFSATSVWAEKYEIITTFRRIVLHHSNLLSDSTVMTSVLNCILDSIASLRSSNVRNGLLCLKKAAHSCNDIWTVENSLAIFTSLLNKSGNGPKFLCDTAFETAQSAAEKCPLTRLIPALQPFLNHKNMEVSCKAIQLMTQSIMQLSTSHLQQLLPPSESSEQLTSMLTCLSAALSAKKALGKEKAKEALRHVKDSLGQEQFEAFIDGHLTAAQSAEIKREVKPATSSVPSSSSVPRPPMSSVFRMKAALGGLPASSSTAPLATVVTSKPWEKPAVSATASTVAVKPWEKRAPLASTNSTAKPWLKQANSSTDNKNTTDNSVDDSLLPAMEALNELDTLF